MNNYKGDENMLHLKTNLKYRGRCHILNSIIELDARYDLVTKKDGNNHIYKVWKFNRVTDFPCEIACGSVTTRCPIYKQIKEEEKVD